MQRDSEKLENKAITSVFWKLFEQGGAAAITLLIQIVMARLLGPKEFGMLAIMLVFINLGNVVVQSGLNTALIQSKEIDDTDLSTVFWLCLAFSIVLYMLVFFFAPSIAAFYNLVNLTEPLRVLAIIFIINSYNSIQEAIVAHILNFKMTFFATVSAGIISGTVGIACAIGGLGIWALVIQQLLFQITKSVVLNFQIKWYPKFIFDLNRAKRHYSFGWKLLLAGLLDQGYQSLSDLLIGKVFNASDLGIVSQGKKYPQAVGILLDGAIQPVVLSTAARVQNNLIQVKQLARRALKTSTFLIVPAMVLFATLARPLIELILGEQWLASVPYLQMYCVVYALLPIHTTNLQIINGIGRSDIFLRLEVIKKIIGIIILLGTVFIVGDLKVIVFGYIITGVLCTFINARPNKTIISYSYIEQLKDIAPAFGLSLIAFIITYPVELLGMPHIILIVVQIILFSAVYLIFAYICKIDAFKYICSKLKRFIL